MFSNYHTVLLDSYDAWCEQCQCRKEFFLSQEIKNILALDNDSRASHKPGPSVHREGSLVSTLGQTGRVGDSFRSKPQKQQGCFILGVVNIKL